MPPFNLIGRFKRAQDEWANSRNDMDFLFAVTQLGNWALVNEDLESLEFIVETLYALPLQEMGEEMRHVITGCGGTLYAGLSLLRVKMGICTFDEETLHVSPNAEQTEIST